VFLIYILNLSVLLFLSFYKPYYQTKFFRFTLINPITLSFIISFPITFFTIFVGPAWLLADPGLNQYYQFALFLTNLSLFLELFVMIWVLKYIKKRVRISNKLLYSKHIRFTPRRFALIGYFFLFLFLCSFYLLANHSFGILNWISNPREGYQLHRSGAGHYYAFCITFLSVSFVASTLSRKKGSTVVMGALPYIYLIYLLGSKGFILNFLIYLIIILWIGKYKYLVPLFIVMIPGVFIVMIYNYGGRDLQSIAAYFDYYLNSAIYYKAYFNGEIDLFLGKIFATSFWGLVPRAFYPDKPYVYGFILVNEHFFPGAAALTSTPAFGGPIGEFADFGVAGVIIFSIFNIRNIVGTGLSFLLFNNINLHTIRSNSKYFYLYIWLLAPSFLMYFPFPLNFILFSSIVFIISFLGRVTTKSKRNGNPLI
jgi:hypothetical protein